MVFWSPNDNWADTSTCQPINGWWKIPLFLVTTLGFHVLMKAAPAQVCVCVK
jgi:hypothetical protein